MEQRFPRIGMAALAISATQFLAVLLNGLLGWLPAGIIGEGTRGQKFHILQYLRQTLNLPYKENGFWSDAGPLSGQEFAMILLMLITLGVGLFGIRDRKSVDGPSSMSADEQRARLDEQAVSVGRPGGLSVVNPTTASIVESVIGKSEVPTIQVISDALGEMTAVAMEMGVDEQLIKGTIIELSEEEQMVLDSRYTVTVDEDEMDVVDLTGTESAVAEGTDRAEGDSDSSDSGYADDWLDGDDWLDDTPTSASEQKSEAAAAEPEPEVEPEPEPEPVTIIATPVSPPTSRIESDYLRPTAPRDAASGSMPVRPQALPDTAEYDIQQECWTMFGRPIEFTETPPPPPTAATAEEPIATVTSQEPLVVSPPPQDTQPPGPRRLPTVPNPPPKKGGKKLPALPLLPRR
jgi:hypothetical protein